MAAKSKGGKPKRALKTDAKRTKAFKASGGLDRQIKERRKYREVKSKIDTRKALRARKSKGKAREEYGGEEEEVEDGPEALERLQGQGEDDDAIDSDEDASELEDELDSLEDDEEDEVAAHKMDLAKLKEQDPEFYKYLAENDKELLDFDEDAEMDEDEDEESEAESAAPSTSAGKSKAKSDVLRSSTVSAWQKAMLQHRSLRSLRSLLLAFRSVAFADDELADNARPLTYIINDADLFSKVVRTALKYTPVVVAHHVPVKEQAGGRVKVPTQSKQYTTCMRLVKSFFASVIRLVSQMSDPDTLQLAINESARLVPYVLADKKATRLYLKAMLDLWATGDDNVRISAFLAIRKVAITSGGTQTEPILRSVYLSLVQAARKTTVYSLPTINLLKNSASELYLLQPASSYQLAFGYIRQLAVHLRNSMKATGKDAYKAVYNWQVVHSIDFWSIVLSAACDKDREAEHGESPLKPLIYPLVEVTLGIARLVPTSRYFPLRFHCIRSLLRISQRTDTLIPLAPLLLDILDSAELKRKGKPSSQLKPLDFEYYVRAPAPYLRTRTYGDGLLDEVIYLLLEVYATHAHSIAFPELALPGVVSLRRHGKKTSNAKFGGMIKALAERLDTQRTWIEARRNKVAFAPMQRAEVEAFLTEDEKAKMPLTGHLRRERKIREQKREMLERAAQGDDEDEEEE